jgi:hypothetical protein
LFLDHYGVMDLASPGFTRLWNSLPTDEELRGRYIFKPFDKLAVSTLNSILAQTGASIVVSSDWKRSASIGKMCEFYREQGIISAPIDYTLWLPGKMSYHQQRATEIQTWLNQHPEVTNWAAIDDLHMGIEANGEKRNWGLDNFVWAENIQAGITCPSVISLLLFYLQN